MDPPAMNAMIRACLRDERADVAMRLFAEVRAQPGQPGLSLPLLSQLADGCWRASQHAETAREKEGWVEHVLELYRAGRQLLARRAQLPYVDAPGAPGARGARQRQREQDRPWPTRPRALDSSGGGSSYVVRHLGASNEAEHEADDGREEEENARLGWGRRERGERGWDDWEDSQPTRDEWRRAGGGAAVADAAIATSRPTEVRPATTRRRAPRKGTGVGDSIGPPRAPPRRRGS